MADQQILKCLSEIEMLFWGEEYSGYDIQNRIVYIARESPNWHRYRVIEWIILNNENATALYQNVIYHMISCLYVHRDPLITTLLGENDEFLLPSECVFTKEVSDLAYELMFDEYLAARQRKEEAEEIE
jgi:hypothetical protein